MNHPAVMFRRSAALMMVICRTVVSLLPGFFRTGLYRIWLWEV
jgi:hypothetical protein